MRHAYLATNADLTSDHAGAGSAIPWLLLVGDCQIFRSGNECGEQVESAKVAWGATCRRAGIAGLRFHDPRREFACRLLESGAQHHDVRDFLGHANITTTSRYLASTPVRLEQAPARMEGSIRTRTQFAFGTYLR